MWEAFIVLLFYFLVPGALALLLTWGAWRHVLKAFVIWYLVLAGSFLLATSGNIDNMAYGALVYGMFLTGMAVPFLSVLLKFIDWLKDMRVAIVTD